MDDSVLMECWGCWKRQPKRTLGTIGGHGRYCPRCRAIIMRIWFTQRKDIPGDGMTRSPAPKRRHVRKPKSRPWWDGTRWVTVVIDVHQ